MVDLPLAGRDAVVTGVSRRRGIGFAVASRLAATAGSLVFHQHSPHDLEEYGESDDLDGLLSEIRAKLADDAQLAPLSGDLGYESVPARLMGDAWAGVGQLDILVCNHAHGGDAVSISDATPDALDRHWTVNTKATPLLTQAFAAQHDGSPSGRVIWMTSGQGLGPMSDNLAYATFEGRPRWRNGVCRGRPRRTEHPPQHREPGPGQHGIPGRYPVNGRAADTPEEVQGIIMMLGLLAFFCVPAVPFIDVLQAGGDAPRTDLDDGTVPDWPTVPLFCFLFSSRASGPGATYAITRRARGPTAISV